MNGTELTIVILSLVFMYAACAAFTAYLDKRLEAKRLEFQLQVEKERTRRDEIIFGLLVSMQREHNARIVRSPP